jgi:rhodanese-related sulfurtransferase
MGAYELLRTHVNDPTFVAVDLRGAGEYAAGHIPGAANVDVAAGDLTQAIATLDKSDSYFLYDAAGGQVEQTAAAMHDAGFKHVYYIEGGYAAWQKQGLPTSG